MENIRELGFLTFHWCVIHYFRKVGLNSPMRIRAYTRNDFSPGGIFYTGERDCSDWMSSGFLSRNFEDLIRYSRQLELCHDGWHMAIEERTGAPLMDPYVNVYRREFWNLHFFINDEFEAQLNSYRSAIQNPALTTSYQAIQHIERRHPGAIERI
jgi:hypothetical protein